MASEQSAKAVKLGDDILKSKGANAAALVPKFVHTCIDAAKECNLENDTEAAEEIVATLESVNDYLSTAPGVPQSAKTDVENAIESVNNIMDDEEDEEEDEEDDEDSEFDEFSDAAQLPMHKSAMIVKFWWFIATTLLVVGGFISSAYLVRASMDDTFDKETDRTLGRHLDIALAAVEVLNAKGKSLSTATLLSTGLQGGVNYTGMDDSRYSPDQHVTEYAAWRTTQSGKAQLITPRGFETLCLARLSTTLHLKNDDGTREMSSLVPTPTFCDASNDKQSLPDSHHVLLSRSEKVTTHRRTPARRLRRVEPTSGMIIEVTRDDWSINELFAQLTQHGGSEQINISARREIQYLALAISTTIVIAIVLTETTIWWISRRYPFTGPIILSVVNAVVVGLAVLVGVAISLSEVNEMYLHTVQENLLSEALTFGRAMTYVNGEGATETEFIASITAISEKRANADMSGLTVFGADDSAKFTIGNGETSAPKRAPRMVSESGDQATASTIILTNSDAASANTVVASTKTDKGTMNAYMCAAPVMVVILITAVINTIFTATSVFSRVASHGLGSYLVRIWFEPHSYKTAFYGCCAVIGITITAAMVNTGNMERDLAQESLVVETSNNAAQVVAGLLQMRSTLDSLVGVPRDELPFIETINQGLPSFAEALLVGAEPSRPKPLFKYQATKYTTPGPVTNVSSWEGGNMMMNLGVSGMQVAANNAPSYATPAFNPLTSDWTPQQAHSTSVIAATAKVDTKTSVIIERQRHSFENGSDELILASISLTISITGFFVAFLASEFLLRSASWSKNMTVVSLIGTAVVFAVLVGTTPAMSGIVSNEMLEPSLVRGAKADLQWMTSLVAKAVQFEASSLATTTSVDPTATAADTTTRLNGLATGIGIVSNRLDAYSNTMKLVAVVQNADESWATVSAKGNQKFQTTPNVKLNDFSEDACSAFPVSMKVDGWSSCVMFTVPIENISPIIGVKKVAVLGVLDASRPTAIASQHKTFMTKLAATLGCVVPVIVMLCGLSVLYLYYEKGSVIYFSNADIHALTADEEIDRTVKPQWLPLYIRKFHVGTITFPVFIFTVYVTAMLLQLNDVRRYCVDEQIDQVDSLLWAGANRVIENTSTPSSPDPLMYSQTAKLWAASAEVAAASGDVLICHANPTLHAAALSRFESLRTQLTTLAPQLFVSETRQTSYLNLVSNLADAINTLPQVTPAAPPDVDSGYSRISQEVAAKVATSVAPFFTIASSLQNMIEAEVAASRAEAKQTTPTSMALVQKELPEREHLTFIANVSKAAHAALEAARLETFHFATVYFATGNSTTDLIGMTTTAMHAQQSIFEAGIRGILEANAANTGNVSLVPVDAAALEQLLATFAESSIFITPSTALHDRLLKLHVLRNAEDEVPTATVHVSKPGALHVVSDTQRLMQNMSTTIQRMEELVRSEINGKINAQTLRRRNLLSLPEQNRLTNRVKDSVVDCSICAIVILVVATVVGLVNGFGSVTHILRLSRDMAKSMPMKDLIRRASTGFSVLNTNPLEERENTKLLDKSAQRLSKHHRTFVIFGIVALTAVFIPCFAGVAVMVDETIDEATEKFKATTAIKERLLTAKTILEDNANLPLGRVQLLAQLAMVSRSYDEAVIKGAGTLVDQSLFHPLFANMLDVSDNFKRAEALPFDDGDMLRMHQARITSTTNHMKVALGTIVDETDRFVNMLFADTGARRPANQMHAIEASSEVAMDQLRSSSPVVISTAGSVLATELTARMSGSSTSPPSSAVQAATSANSSADTGLMHLASLRFGLAEAQVALAATASSSPSSVKLDLATTLDSVMSPTNPFSLSNAVQSEATARFGDIRQIGSFDKVQMAPAAPAGSLLSVLQASTNTHKNATAAVFETDFILQFASNRGFAQQSSGNFTATLENFKQDVIDEVYVTTAESRIAVQLKETVTAVYDKHRGAEWSGIVGLWVLGFATMLLGWQAGLMA